VVVVVMRWELCGSDDDEEGPRVKIFSYLELGLESGNGIRSCKGGYLT
jgi:hypothetical protein